MELDELNPLRRALTEATDSQVSELLSPFKVKTFPELLSKFSELEAFKKMYVQEQETRRKTEENSVNKKLAISELEKIGVKITEGSPIVEAYMLLTGDTKTEFVKSLLPSPMSNLRDGIMENKNVKAPDEKLQDLVGAFPNPIK